MKDWFIGHKIHLFVAALIVLGGIYYFYIHHDGPNLSSANSINAVENQLQSDRKEEEKKQPQAQTDKQLEAIMVDVKGQIKHPGVYQSNQGERVIDVINRAGGLTNKADESQVNFAEHVQDEMVIDIPAKGEMGSGPSEVSAGGAVTSTGSNSSTLVDLNKADETQLQTLPGIGPAKASAIIDYREKTGSFKTIEDLKNITGIGDKTFEKLKDLIAVH